MAFSALLHQYLWYTLFNLYISVYSTATQKQDKYLMFLIDLQKQILEDFFIVFLCMECPLTLALVFLK